MKDINSRYCSNFKKTVTAVAVSLSLGISATAFAASNTAGSIYGKAEAGSTITYTNVATGVTRKINVDKKGHFNVNSVPAGNYSVMDEAGVVRQIKVLVGTGSNVSFDGDIEVFEVNGNRVRTIDTSSVESSSVFTAEDIDLLPMPRNSVAVALLTPGAVQGGDNFGRNVPSFGGSSVAENGYYIDGMDVTNLRNLLQFSSLPQDAIAQTQVKSGGYGVEYGRSLGGIINVISRSGSNEWEFGGSSYARPESLMASGKDVKDYESVDGGLLSYNSDDESYKYEYNVYAAGPIIEDKLFFFANLEGQQRETNNYSAFTSYKSEVDNPNYMAKVDWYITPDHLLSVTAIDNETEYDRVNYDNTNGDSYTGRHGDVTSKYTYKEGGDILIANYTGYITDDLSVNLMYGKLEHTYLKVPNLPGDDCAYSWDTTGDKTWGLRESIGCWNAPVQSTVVDQVDDKDERTSYKVDFDWTIGDHNVRFGYNSEDYDSTSPGEKYSGDIYYRYMTGNASNEGTLNGTDIGIGTEAVRVRQYQTQTATFGVENTAWYIEDNWQVTNNVMVYGGVRGETFTNKDGNGDIFVESDTLIAPRIGFSWDIDGDSSKKLYGTLGRYYIPIAANTNIRATREEEFYENWYFAPDGWDASGAPVTLGAEFGTSVTDVQIADPRKIADHDLEPMHQDEIIIGYQQEYSEDWTLGVKFMGRTIQDGMDDFCGHDGFTNWAKDNGYDNFDPHSLQGCIIVNPGNDITISMDLENDGNLSTVTTPSEYHGLPEYKRHYLGLEFTAEKSFSDSWKGNFSYVLSRSWGNAEGYVNSTLGQEDAGATQDFDHQNFMDGSYGDLPNDHRHQFKAYGLYEVNDELSVALNVSAISGQPLSCNGYISTDGMLEGDGSTAYDYGNFKRYSASSFYCVNEDGETELNGRGDEGESNWVFNTDMSVNYMPSWAEGVTLQATVFNLFNSQKATTTNQVKDLDRGSSVVSNNFLTPSGYQSARYVQFAASYKF